MRRLSNRTKAGGASSRGGAGSRRGFALPMSVMVVGGLLVLMVGLLAVMRLERRTARAFSDITRAELALAGGLAEAKTRLAQAAADGALVFRVEQGTDAAGREQFLTCAAVFDEATKARMLVPLVSGIEDKPLPDTGIPELPKDLTVIARLTSDDVLSPRAKWVEVPTADGHTLRYAWWAEDLGGRIDGEMAGLVERVPGDAPSELGLYTLFRPAEDKDTNAAGPEDKLVEERGNLRTAGTTRVLLGKEDARKCEPWLVYGLPKPLPEQVLVPRGLGYADEGQPAFDLNSAVGKRDVDGIARQIARNLPDFVTRKGGFPADSDYLKTLAASMIDYADADSDATIGTNFRGVDSYPFVNEIYDRYEWLTGATQLDLKIQVRTFVELWNPSDQAISGVIRLENDNQHQINVPGKGFQRFGSVLYAPQPVTLPPNGFVVIECQPAAGPNVYQFQALLPPPRTSSGPYLEFPSAWTTESTYRMQWNGVLVDWARGGIARTDGTLRQGAGQAKWKGQGSVALETTRGQEGDPRASWYIADWIYPNTYTTNSNWGGRALKRGINAPAYNEVKLSVWPDPGHDSTAGTAASSDSVLPTTLKYPANQPLLAPARISNRERYTSVGELGHIFDPAQWNDVEKRTGTASPAAGGGFTLAIGRPELGVFDKDGRRAAQLCDLFSVHDKALRERRGLINVNTAARPVLRALVAGTVLDDDPAIAPQVVPRASQAGDRFADAVIAARTVRPLRGLSDLARVELGGVPFFGDLRMWDAGKRPAADWDDAGREELFAKVANWAAFGSKSYAVWVTGQVVSAKGETLATRSRCLHITVRIPRDADGKATGEPPRFIHSYESTR